MADTDVKTENKEECVVEDEAEPAALALLILLNAGVEPSEENICKLISAAKATVKASYPKVFAEASSKIDLKDLVQSYGKGGFGGSASGGAAGGAAGGGGGAAGGAAASGGAAKEAEPEAEPESSVAAPGMGFDDSSSEESSD